MSVYQVEEFYIYIPIAIIKDECKEKIETYLSENGLDDYEFQDDDLTVNSLTCESEAESHSADLLRIIATNN